MEEELAGRTEVRAIRSYRLPRTGTGTGPGILLSFITSIRKKTTWMTIKYVIILMMMNCAGQNENNEKAVVIPYSQVYRVLPPTVLHFQRPNLSSTIVMSWDGLNSSTLSAMVVILVERCWLWR